MAYKLVKVDYEASVTEQAYLNGVPLFKPEEINVPKSRSAYFSSEYPIAEIFAKWNSQHPWQYVIKKVSKIAEDEVPRYSQIWTSVFDFYTKHEQETYTKHDSRNR